MKMKMKVKSKSENWKLKSEKAKVKSESEKVSGGEFLPQNPAAGDSNLMWKVSTNVEGRARSRQQDNQKKENSSSSWWLFRFGMDLNLDLGRRKPFLFI